LCKAEIFKE